MEPQRFKARPDEVIDREQSEDNVADDSAATLVSIGQTVGEINQKSDNILENQQVMLARTNAIFTQGYELAQFKVPRLFVVFPE